MLNYLMSKPIIVTKEINCKKDKVWSAITVFDEMHQWYFEQIDSFEAKVGFATEFVIQNEGRNFTHQWKVLEVKTNEVSFILEDGQSIARIKYEMLNKETKFLIFLLL